jgi:DNA-binding LytR/AlgR family response regulator
MKKVFIIDEDKNFQKLIKNNFNSTTTDLNYFKSSIEVLLIIEEELPDLIFLNLEISDLNDFVMYDILKKAATSPPIPVIITYSEKSIANLDQYKKLKYKPNAFYQKPISDEDIKKILSQYMGDYSEEEIPGEEDELEKTFIEDSENSNNTKDIKHNLLAANQTDENEDEDEKTFIQENSTDDDTKDLEKTLTEDDEIIFSELSDSSSSESEAYLESEGEDLPLLLGEEEEEEGEMPLLLDDSQAEMDQKQGIFSVSDGFSEVDKDKIADKELVAKMVSLERQTKFLNKEKDRLTKEIETLKDNQKENKSKESVKELEAKLRQSESDRKELDRQCDELKLRCVQLEESEGKLNKKLEELTAKMEEQSNDESLKKEFNKKEKELLLEIDKLDKEKIQLDDDHKVEMKKEKDLNKKLQTEINELKEQEATLSNTISSLEEDKKSVSSQLTLAERNIELFEKEKDLMTQKLSSVEEESGKLKDEIKSLTKELRTNKEKLDSYQKKSEELDKIIEKIVQLSKNRE